MPKLVGPKNSKSPHILFEIPIKGNRLHIRVEPQGQKCTNRHLRADTTGFLHMNAKEVVCVWWQVRLGCVVLIWRKKMTYWDHGLALADTIWIKKLPEKSRLEVQKGELKIDIGASFSVPTKRLKWSGLVRFGNTRNGNEAAGIKIQRLSFLPSNP